MSTDLEGRVASLERSIRSLSGSFQGLALLIAARVDSQRAFDQPTPYGLSPWHGTWEITCARYMLEQLDAFMPADPSTPEADGLAHVREILAAAIHGSSDPNDRAWRADRD